MNAVTDEMARVREDRGPTWCAIFDTLRHYRLPNMVFEGTDEAFCLIDLVSTIGGDISTGEDQLLQLADEISIALDPHLTAALSIRQGGVKELDVDALAQEIRRVDGKHDLGAGALAEALLPFLSALSPAQEIADKPSAVSVGDGYKACPGFIADPCGSASCANCGKRRAEHAAQEGK